MQFDPTQVDNPYSLFAVCLVVLVVAGTPWVMRKKLPPDPSKEEARASDAVQVLIDVVQEAQERTRTLTAELEAAGEELADAREQLAKLREKYGWALAGIRGVMQQNPALKLELHPSVKADL
ncbi:hypothetical protein QP446_04225 [Corynebacterium riegelii]|uniref:hypothetical protein n=1 Tax=Corynebacterium riegelii TaxID=156976 RepID=UPI00254E48A0|nr:hypothetical protein [Corynebacterium riegelii]MDK7179975.1 hypothetical protein [Corynebacterium riegelii]